jgi:hypothetical protein
MHGHYSHTDHPHLTLEQTQATEALLHLLNSWFGSNLGNILVVHERIGVAEDQSLPGESLTLIRLAVKSFIEEVYCMKGEFEIITGLQPSDAETLLAKLA